MTEGEVALLLEGPSGVIAVTVSSQNGAPEVSWGDSFFSLRPRSDRGAAAPFATIVTKDYPGSGTSSKLDRPGVFRLNLALGRETFPAAVRLPAGRVRRSRCEARLHRAGPYRSASCVRMAGLDLGLDPGSASQRPGTRADRPCLPASPRSVLQSRPVRLLLSVTAPGPRERPTPRPALPICRLLTA